MIIYVSRPAQKYPKVCPPQRKYHQRYRNCQLYENKKKYVGLASTCPPSLSVTNNTIHLSIDIPGIKAKDLAVKMECNTLTISGLRHNRQFLRRFVIDSTVMDTSQLKANLADGVLVITGPKKAPVDDLAINITTDTKDDGSGQESSTSKQQKGCIKKELFKMYLDVPGVKKADLKVEVINNRKCLRVSGCRLGHQPFVRNFAITSSMIDICKLEGNLNNGVLVLKAPQKNKNENSKTISMDIKVTTNAHHEDGSDINCKCTSNNTGICEEACSQQSKFSLPEQQNDSDNPGVHKVGKADDANCEMTIDESASQSEGRNSTVKKSEYATQMIPALS